MYESKTARSREFTVKNALRSLVHSYRGYYGVHHLGALKILPHVGGEISNSKAIRGGMGVLKEGDTLSANSPVIGVLPGETFLPPKNRLDIVEEATTIRIEKNKPLPTGYWSEADIAKWGSLLSLNNSTYNASHTVLPSQYDHIYIGTSDADPNPQLELPLFYRYWEGLARRYGTVQSGTGNIYVWGVTGTPNQAGRFNTSTLLGSGAKRMSLWGRPLEKIDPEEGLPTYYKGPLWQLSYKTPRGINIYTFDKPPLYDLNVASMALLYGGGPMTNIVLSRTRLGPGREYLQTWYVLDRAPVFNGSVQTSNGVSTYTSPTTVSVSSLGGSVTIDLPSSIPSGWFESTNNWVETASQTLDAFKGLPEFIKIVGVTGGDGAADALSVQFTGTYKNAPKASDGGTDYVYYGENYSVEYGEPGIWSSPVYEVEEDGSRSALLPKLQITGLTEHITAPTNPYIITLEAWNRVGNSFLKIPVQVAKRTSLFTVSPAGADIVPTSETSFIQKNPDGSLHATNNGEFGPLENVVYISSNGVSVITSDGVVRGYHKPQYDALKALDPDGSKYGKIIAAEGPWVITDFGARYKIGHSYFCSYAGNFKTLYASVIERWSEDYVRAKLVTNRPEFGNFKSVCAPLLTNPNSSDVSTPLSFFIRTDGTVLWEEGDYSDGPLSVLGILPKYGVINLDEFRLTDGSAYGTAILPPGPWSFRLPALTNIKKIGYFLVNSRNRIPDSPADNGLRGLNLSYADLFMFALRNDGELETYRGWVSGGSRISTMARIHIPDLSKYKYSDIEVGSGAFIGVTQSKRILVAYGQAATSSSGWTTMILPNQKTWSKVRVSRKSQAVGSPAYKDLSFLTTLDSSGEVKIVSNSYISSEDKLTGFPIPGAALATTGDVRLSPSWVQSVGGVTRTLSRTGETFITIYRGFSVSGLSPSLEITPTDLPVLVKYFKDLSPTADPANSFNSLPSSALYMPGSYEIWVKFTPLDAAGPIIKTLGDVEIVKVSADIRVEGGARVTHGVSSLESLLPSKVSISPNNLQYDYQFEALPFDVIAEDGSTVLYEGDTTPRKVYTPPNETPTLPGAYRVIIKIKDSEPFYSGTSASALWYIEPNPAISLPPQFTSASQTLRLNRQISNIVKVTPINTQTNKISEWSIDRRFSEEVRLLSDTEPSSRFSEMRVIGNLPVLGAWQLPSSIQMSRANVPAGYHWAAEVTLPTVSGVEFKFVVGTENQWDIPGNSLIENWGENDLPGSIGYLVGDPGSLNNIKFWGTFRDSNPGVTQGVPAQNFDGQSYRFLFNEITFEYAIQRANSQVSVAANFSLEPSRGAWGGSTTIPITAIGPGGRTTVNITVVDISPDPTRPENRGHLTLKKGQSFRVARGVRSLLNLDFFRLDGQNIFPRFEDDLNAEHFLLRRQAIPAPTTLEQEGTTPPGRWPFPSRDSQLELDLPTSPAIPLSALRSFGKDGNKTYACYWHRKSAITRVSAVFYNDIRISQPIVEGDITFDIDVFRQRVFATAKQLGVYRFRLVCEKTVYYYRIDFKLARFFKKPWEFAKMPGDLKKGLKQSDWIMKRDWRGDEVPSATARSTSESFAYPFSVKNKRHTQVMSDIEIEMLVTPKEDYSVMGDSNFGKVSRGMFIGSDPINIYHGEELIYETGVLTPSAPEITNVEPGNAQLIAYFTAPESGEGPILNYEYSVGSGPWVSSSPAASSSPIIVTGGMVNGTQYSFRIRAVNGFGPGAASPPATGTPLSVPLAPNITSVTPFSGQLVVSFTAPQGPVTNYQYSTNGGSSWTSVSPASTATTITITGLTNGQTYQVKVRAVNQIGVGAPSETVEGALLPPPSPATVTFYKTDNTATLGLFVPEIPNVVGVEIERSVPGLTSPWGDPTIIQRNINDLGFVFGEIRTTFSLPSYNRDYNVRVRLLNSIGAGAWSTSATVSARRKHLVAGAGVNEINGTYTWNGYSPFYAFFGSVWMAYRGQTWRIATVQGGGNLNSLELQEYVAYQSQMSFGGDLTLSPTITAGTTFSSVNGQNPPPIVTQVDDSGGPIKPATPELKQLIPDNNGSQLRLRASILPPEELLANDPSAGPWALERSINGGQWNTVIGSTGSGSLNISDTFMDYISPVVIGQSYTVQYRIVNQNGAGPVSNALTAVATA